MRQLFIEARYRGKIKIKNISKLPQKIGLATTVQFLDQLDDVKKQLKGKKVFLGKGKQKYKSQILGCDVSSAKKIKDDVDAFLYIGTGQFHPIALGLLGKDVYILNPFDGKISELDKKKIESYNKRRKGAMIKFLSSENIGVLVSTKIGQKYSMKTLEFLEKKYKDKKFYFFITDNVDISQLENFPFIDSWINTACPRLEGDFGFVNILDLK
ncbi:hypothetical protein CEE44_04030 [Candidatus Woesearchaeota archaeon B3_Woes]|nr:MAG: hypothetical protein CEE44_04030 [Candidatus Woesearchaeota archaeon B3_Woes]